MRHLIALIALAVAACGPIPSASGDNGGIQYEQSCPCLPSNAPSGLAFDPAYIWSATPVNICFDNGSSNAKRWVKDAISKTWGLASQLQFTWLPCGHSQQEVHVRFDAELAVNGIGVQLNHISPGLTLGTIRDDERDLRMQAIFGFGFVMGFAAGQDRYDSSCDRVRRFPQHAMRILGPWDSYSTMNECNAPTYNWGLLSNGDISGAQQVYGRPDINACVCPSP